MVQSAPESEGCPVKAELDRGGDVPEVGDDNQGGRPYTPSAVIVNKTALLRTYVRFS